MTDPTDISVAAIRAKLEAAPERTELDRFVSHLVDTPQRLRLEPWQQRMIDTLMDETRKNPIRVELYRGPRRGCPMPLPSSLFAPTPYRINARLTHPEEPTCPPP